jgi:hypothetical protein
MPITTSTCDGKQGHGSFVEFYDQFFERYTFTEFVLDVFDAYRLAGECRCDNASAAKSIAESSEMLLGRVTEANPTQFLSGCTPALLHEALNCFLAKKVLNSHREALFSIRTGGISTRTIRNWKKNGNIYSAGSSKTLNSLFDQLLPTGALIDRKRLAWLWLAERLKLNDAETNSFLKNCMGEQHIYALNLQETVLRTVISINSRQKMPFWNFFEAVSFCLELQGEITADAFAWRTSRDRVLEALRGTPDGCTRVLADELSLIYEDIVGHLAELDAHTEDPALRPSQRAVVTERIERSYRGDFESILTYVDGSESNGIQHTPQSLKIQITQWAQDNSLYLKTAYLSGLLTVVGLLIDFAVRAARTDEEQNLFKLFYFYASRAVTGSPKERVEAQSSFPADIDKMASVLVYEEGVAFERFAREKCLTYFERLLDVPSRLSRRRLIEFYLLTQLQHAQQQKLDFILTRHRFRGLEEGDGDELLLRFFKACAEKPPQSALQFAEALAAFRTRSCRLPQERQSAVDWPVHEKLFRWKY